MKQYFGNEVPFATLLGKTLTRCECADHPAYDAIVFECTDGSRYRMFHWQDCYEDVSIEDICGDLACLVGSPIVQADESTNEDNPKTEWEDDFLWTFYRIATAAYGGVTIRWYGSSNGYYSMSVGLYEMRKPTNAESESDDAHESPDRLGRDLTVQQVAAVEFSA